MAHYDEVWKEDKPDKCYKTSVPDEIILMLRKGQKALDLGSGDGSNLLKLKELGLSVVGMEVSVQGIKKTHDKDPSINVIERSIFESLPFEDGFFDIVIAYQSLNHATKDRILNSFQEVRRVLKKEGLFSLKMAYYREGAYKKQGNDFIDPDFSDKFRMIDVQTYLPLEGPEKGLIHFLFKEEELKTILTDIGFEIISFSKDNRHLTLLGRKTRLIL